MKTIRSDGQLIDQFLTGQKEDSESAFETLVKRHGPMVLGVCRHVLNRVQDAEDAFQATFFALARKAGTIRDREIVGCWLHEVAYRTAIRARERRADPRRGSSFRWWKNLTRGPSTLRVKTSSDCSSARRSMACPPSTAHWCCTPTSKARATSRSPACFNVRSAQSRGGCRGPATCCERGSAGAATTRTRSDIDGDEER